MDPARLKTRIRVVGVQEPPNIQPTLITICRDSLKSRINLSRITLCYFEYYETPFLLHTHPTLSWHTVRNLHFFVEKFNFEFPRKLSIFFGWKTRENVGVLDFLAVDNFDFMRKIVKKYWLKNSWKCWGFFVKIEFLDKNLTFRIVCLDGWLSLKKKTGQNELLWLSNPLSAFVL